jgi:hypothetical protein
LHLAGARTRGGCAPTNCTVQLIQLVEVRIAQQHLLLQCGHRGCSHIRVSPGRDGRRRRSRINKQNCSIDKYLIKFNNKITKNSHTFLNFQNERKKTQKMMMIHEFYKFMNYISLTTIVMILQEIAQQKRKNRQTKKKKKRPRGRKNKKA